jgi:alpha-L-fucosidase
MVCLPPECDVAIRRNWFWQPDDLHTLKSAEHLLGIWYRSVGLGANLLLDMGPDQRGRISDEDAGRWMEVRRELDLRFAQPMPATLEPVEGGVDLTFGKPVTLDHLWLSEVLDDGQVVDGFEVLDAAGEPVAEGRSIGRRRVLVFPERTTDRLHLRWTGPAGCLASAEAYHTGHTELPALGDKLDYDAWAAKADPK